MIRELKITPVLNGYIVTAGCQQVVFQGKNPLLKALDSYLTDPDREEARWLKDSENAKWKIVPPLTPERSNAGLQRSECGTGSVNGGFGTFEASAGTPCVPITFPDPRP